LPAHEVSYEQSIVAPLLEIRSVATAFIEAADERARLAIYAANLIDFRPDGTATAAFVMPSCISGRPAHRADPIANDQDWALYWPLHFAVERGEPA
jgi:hypothetical protein